jgi:hypothetical protein
MCRDRPQEVESVKGCKSILIPPRQSNLYIDNRLKLVKGQRQGRQHGIRPGKAVMDAILRRVVMQ